MCEMLVKHITMDEILHHIEPKCWAYKAYAFISRKTGIALYYFLM